ncbi:hypothetical protein [Coleofasciculus sp. F4-SAH-05]|uniref:hypothetical protein n=1 Tax=Coleofasciculus sp. F4-SAH-05 TaxID=3069525 RepID=UPI0033002EE5
MSFVICHLSFVICHLSFVICHSSFVICSLIFPISQTFHGYVGTIPAFYLLPRQRSNICW